MQKPLLWAVRGDPSTMQERRTSALLRESRWLSPTFETGFQLDFLPHSWDAHQSPGCTNAGCLCLLLESMWLRKWKRKRCGKTLGVLEILGPEV